MKNYRLQIVTPEGTAFNGEVEYATLPGTEGEFGVYAGHEAIITTLNPGEVVIRQESGETALAIGKGFAEVGGDHLSILTEVALRDSQIDEKNVEESIRKAKEALSHVETLSVEDVTLNEALIARSTVQLNLKRRKSGSHSSR